MNVFALCWDGKKSERCQLWLNPCSHSRRPLSAPAPHQAQRPRKVGSPCLWSHCLDHGTYSNSMGLLWRAPWWWKPGDSSRKEDPGEGSSVTLGSGSFLEGSFARPSFGVLRCGYSPKFVFPGIVGELRRRTLKFSQKAMAHAALSHFSC